MARSKDLEEIWKAISQLQGRIPCENSLDSEVMGPYNSSNHPERLTIKEMLQHKIGVMKREIQEFQCLHDSLPDVMLLSADAGLQNIMDYSGMF